MFKSAVHIFKSISDPNNVCLALFLDRDYPGCLKSISNLTENHNGLKILSMALEKKLFDFSLDLVTMLLKGQTLDFAELLCREYEKRGLITELLSMLEKIYSSEAQKLQKTNVSSILCLFMLKYRSDAFLAFLDKSKTHINISWLLQRIATIFPDGVYVYEKINLLFLSKNITKIMTYIFRFPALLSIHHDLCTIYTSCVKEVESNEEMIEKIFFFHLSFFPTDVFNFFKDIPLSQKNIRRIFEKLNASGQSSSIACMELIQHYHQCYDIEPINDLFHNLSLQKRDYKSIEISINSKSNFDKKALLDMLANISDTQCRSLSGNLCLKMGQYSKALELFDDIGSTSAIVSSLAVSKSADFVIQSLELFYKRQDMLTFVLILFHCFDLITLHSLLSLIWLGSSSYNQAFFDASFPLIIAKTCQLESHLNKSST